MPAATEAPKKWDGGHWALIEGRSLGRGLNYSPVWEVWGVTPGKF